MSEIADPGKIYLVPNRFLHRNDDKSKACISLVVTKWLCDFSDFEAGSSNENNQSIKNAMTRNAPKPKPCRRNLYGKNKITICTFLAKLAVRMVRDIPKNDEERWRIVRIAEAVSTALDAITICNILQIILAVKGQFSVERY